MLSNIITVENLLFQADKLKKRILSRFRQNGCKGSISLARNQWETIL